ncbi:MAG: recombinase family protein [Desulfobulbaceae bacterium]|nr:recombinase family protein [Desulfobulbaceae bacterium]
MSVFGYIFLALEKEHQRSKEEQQAALYDYAQSVGLEVSEFFVEEGVSLKRPFLERIEGGRLVAGCVAGDVVITMNAAWLLSSAGEGAKLLRTLRKKDVSLYCVDLGENISVDEKRKLVVSEGSAGIVQKLLLALSVCESSSHGEAIRATKKSLKKQGKYIGGPVPFGWQVNEERILVQNKVQQKIIQAIIKMREDRWSYRDISKKLDAEFDIQLSHAGVRRILDSDKKKKEAVVALKNKK